MVRIWMFLAVSFVLFQGCSLRNFQAESSRGEDIFDPVARNRWQGTTSHWRWEGDRLIGETKEGAAIDRGSFFIWDRKVKDFILTISFRISEFGNSGIYYRSEKGPEGYDALLGYQADIDGQNQYTGIVYENFLERHRKILSRRGEFVRISPTDTLKKYRIFTPEEEEAADIYNGDWNDYELTVRGPVIIQKLNGKIVSMVEDRAENRIREGWLGFQLHEGPPMKIEFRNAIYFEIKE